MIIPVAPLYKVGDSVWFNDIQGTMKYGKVNQVGGMFDGDGVRYYYGVTFDAGDVEEFHTVSEKDIPNTRVNIPQPKFRVGENIRFTWTDKEKKTRIEDGIIERVEIHINEGDQIDMVYFIDEEEEFWIYESEILGFVESLLDDKEDKVAPV